MVRAYRAAINAIRRSPNCYAAICGLSLMALPPLFWIVALSVNEMERRGELGPKNALTLPASAWGWAADSYLGISVVLMAACVGYTMLMLAATRIFKPRS